MVKGISERGKIMKPFDLVKVTDKELLRFAPMLKDNIGKVVEQVIEYENKDYFKVAFRFGDKVQHFALCNKDVEVVYKEEFRKYSYDLWKQYYINKLGAMTTSLLINMGGGDYLFDGEFASVLRDKGRIVVPEWYYYEIENWQTYQDLI